MANSRTIFAACAVVVPAFLLSCSTHSRQTHSATVSWQRSSSPVKGYCVYRGTHSGGPYQRIHCAAGDETTFIDSSVTGGRTYYYVVTSIAPPGTEGARSTEVVASIPGR